MKIMPQDLTEGVKFKIFDSEDVWTVCVNPYRPEGGQCTTWAHKPALFATVRDTEGDQLGIILLSEVEKIL